MPQLATEARRRKDRKAGRPRGEEVAKRTVTGAAQADVRLGLRRPFIGPSQRSHTRSKGAVLPPIRKMEVIEIARVILISNRGTGD